MYGVKLASAGDDVKLWDCSDFSFLKQFNPHDQNVCGLSWSNDNNMLSSCAINSDRIAIYSVKNTAVPVTELECVTGKLCLDFNSTSRYLISGGSDQTITLWDLKSRKIKKTYKDHKGPVTSAKFNWNDTHIASGSESGEIIVYNVVTGQGCRPMIAPKIQAVKQLQFSRFRKALLGAVSDDGAVNLWDINTRRLVHGFSDAHRAPATGINFSPINDILFMSVGLDKRIICYDVQNKKPVKTMMAESPLTSIDVMSDGATVAVGSTRGKIYVYDLRQGSKPFKILNAHKSSVQSLKFQNSTASHDMQNGKVDVSVPKNVNNNNNLSPPNRRQLPSAPSDMSKANVLKDVDSMPMSTFLAYLEIDSSGDDSVNFTPSNQQRVDVSDDVFSPIHDGIQDSKTPEGLAQTDNQSASSNSRSFIKDMGSPYSTILNCDSGSSSEEGVFSPFGEKNDTDSHYRNTSIGNSPFGIPSTNFVTSHHLTSPMNENYHQSTSTIPTKTPDPISASHISPAPNMAPSASHTDYTSSYHPSPNYDSRPDLSQQFPKTISNDGSPPFPSNTSRNFLTSQSSSVQALSRQSPSVVGISASPSIPVMKRLDDSPSGSSGGGNISPTKTIQSPEGAHAVSSVAISQQNQKTYSDSPGAMGASHSQNFQSQFIRNLIYEALEDFRDQVHDEIRTLHVEMLRQFQIQQNEMSRQLQHYSVNQDLLTEVEKLREENKRLKKKF